MTTCRKLKGQVGFGPFTAQWPDTREKRYEDKRTCKCAKMLVKWSSVARSKQRAEGETVWSSGTRRNLKYGQWRNYRYPLFDRMLFQDFTTARAARKCCLSCREISSRWRN